MVKRWVQENDFKYLIKHFGINQITTYAFTDYNEPRDQIENKTYKHKALRNTKNTGTIKDSFIAKIEIRGKASRVRQTIIKKKPNVKKKYGNMFQNEILNSNKNAKIPIKTFQKQTN